MKNRIRWITGLLALVFIITGVWIMVSDYRQKVMDQQEYERLAREAQQTTAAPIVTEPETEAETEPETEPETEAYVSPIDFEMLAETNPDIVGWVTIPDTKIDYPIVYTDNNDTYLHTSFEGEESVTGAIYLDCDSEPDFSGWHNIIYGHNMKNGSMFKDIVKYKQEDYFNEHQDIFIYLPDREIHLKAAAALYTDAAPIKRKTKFQDEDALTFYMDEMTKGCKFRKVPEAPVKQLYSFITCSYEFDNARTILYAYEVE